MGAGTTSSGNYLEQKNYIASFPPRMRGRKESKMECTYFEFEKLFNKLFFGVALTDEHLNTATEQIRLYLVSGGAGEVVKMLNVGIKVVSKESFLLGEEIVSRRFVWLAGDQKGEELTANEIFSIGMYLKYGPFYNKLKSNI